MSDIKEKGRAGSSFDDFLKSEGRYEEATEQAVKRVLAFQLIKKADERFSQHLKLLKEKKS